MIETSFQLRFSIALYQEEQLLKIWVNVQLSITGLTFILCEARKKHKENDEP